MKYAFLNAFLGLVFLAYAVALPSCWAWLLAWLGLCFVAAGFAYGRRSAGIYGKRPGGSLPLWSWLLFLPMHLYVLAVWHLFRLLSREPAISPVTDRLLIGRRLLAHELPSSVCTVVDLTAEFREPPGIPAGRDYRSFPILDATAPDATRLMAFIQSLPDTPTYIHCAQGHGRTGVFTLAYLVSRGMCASLDEARALLASVRPLLSLNREQEDFISSLATTHFT